MLATPITPAVLIGHVNAAPRSVTLASCGWDAEEIARRVLGEVMLGGKIVDLARQCKALAGMEAGLIGVWATARSGRLALHVDEVNAARQSIGGLLKTSRAALVAAMETAGVSVSVSAYNADQDCLTVYIDGKPVCHL